jgi:hypothetical protein
MDHPFLNKKIILSAVIGVVVLIILAVLAFNHQSKLKPAPSSYDSYSVSGRFVKMSFDTSQQKWQVSLDFITDFGSKNRTGIINGQTIFYALDKKTGAKVATNGTSDIKKGDIIGVSSAENILETEKPFVIRTLILYK